jgi:hypothetical protein
MKLSPILNPMEPPVGMRLFEGARIDMALYIIRIPMKGRENSTAYSNSVVN